MQVAGLVQVWAPVLGRASTGHVIGDRLVLTAWHSTAGRTVDDGAALQVRVFDQDGCSAWAAARRIWPTTVPDLGTRPGSDVALLEVTDPDWVPPTGLEPVRFGRIATSEPLVCRAVAFPRAEMRPDTERGTKGIEGRTEPHTALGQGLLAFHVTNSVPRGEDEWSGGSGAALYCGEVIIGVLVVDQDGYGGTQLRAADLAVLADHSDFAEALRAAGVQARFEPVTPPATDAGSGRWPRWVGVIPPEAECFQPRAALSELAATLQAAGTAVLCEVLAGAGGVGKTQLAAHYARGCWSRGEVDALVWLTAGNRESIVAQYARAAAVLGAPDPVPEDPEQAAQAFLAWLAGTGRVWLVVLDDLADPGDLKGLWPPQHATGRTVVTTRRRDAALGGAGRRRVAVEAFTESEAVAYVTAKLAAHGRDDDPAQVAGLARELGYLPIALAQAVTYLVDVGLDCAGYRARWADRRRSLAALVPQDAALPDDQSAGLAAVWSLSVQRADALEPVGLAGPLLQLASLLDPNGIPLQVLTAGPALTYATEHRQVPSRSAARGSAETVSVEQARDAVAALARLSLCTVEAHDPYRAVRVHALIQRATREALDPEQLREAARAAADALLQVWPQVERDGALALALRGNTENLDDNARDALWDSDEHSVLFRAGRSLGESGLVAEAITYFQRLHQHAIIHLGPDHPNTLTTRSNLARWRGEAGDPAGAATAFEELLADRLRVLGPDHPNTLTTRSNLASWRGEAGDPAGAATAFEELLADRLRVLGPDHPDTLTTRNNLAYWREAAERSSA